MTETNMILSNPYHGERRAGFVGLPLPGVEVRAVPEDDAAEHHSSGAGPSAMCHVSCCQSPRKLLTNPRLELPRALR